MACTTIESIVKGCENNQGGIYNLWITDQDNVTGTTIDDANWEITAMTHSAGFETIEFKRYVGNFTEEMANSNENGSSVVTATLNLMLQRRDGAKSRALKILSEGNRYLAIIVEDGNGKYWYLPYMQLTTTAEGSGQARADGSKYSVIFVGENPTLAYEVDSAVIATIEEVVS